MLQLVDVGERSLDDYRGIAADFLLPRLLLNELALIGDLAEDRPRREADRSASDPVCGMAIADASGAPSVSHAGRRYLFCSQHCKVRFIDDPTRFLKTWRATAAVP